MSNNYNTNLTVISKITNVEITPEIQKKVDYMISIPKKNIIRIIELESHQNLSKTNNNNNIKTKN
jgi:hypothetical protein